MNNQTRKQIAKLIEKVNNLQSEISGIIEDVEIIRDEEQEKLDNMPESLQYSEKGERLQEVIDNLESAISDLEGVDLDSIISSLEEASA